ncbi:MAG: NAD(P)/FAD-dependent oxidoreductase [Gammaproteobacteria bacterium]|nr:NAD(P)/FAD-dependent oxidoreductase [Gammaproteobacteria bacterium]
MFKKKIVIVGGGAGGLELATKVGRKFGKAIASVVLIDRNPSHLWKPLLHEVASGYLDAGIDGWSYRMHAKKNHFFYRVGTMAGIDRQNRRVVLAPLLDEEGEQVLPERHQDYDLLIIAIGSVTNDFGTKGAAEHCIFLDHVKQALQFRYKLRNQIFKAHYAAATSAEKHTIRVAIVGAGATGVELSAELVNTLEQMQSYGGLRLLDKDSLEISIIEAGSRILPALPEKIALSTQASLEKLGIRVLTNTRVSEITAESVITSDGRSIPSDLKVWAAGIKGPDVLKNSDGLELDQLTRLVVKPNLQTTRDDCIYVIGDAASCPLPDGSGIVPARAQSAHQMASHMGKHMDKILQGKAIPDYVYSDFGSLVSLSHYATVGSLMSRPDGKGMYIQGKLAKMMYISLYRMHQFACFGLIRTLLIALNDRIHRVIRPPIKLH